MALLLCPNPLVIQLWGNNPLHGNVERLIVTPVQLFLEMWSYKRKVVSKMSKIKETDKGVITGLGTWYQMSHCFKL